VQLLASIDAAPRPLAGDRGALQQALLNLLDNARKYGGSRVTLYAAPADGAYVIRVRDSGPGIPPAERARVFDRFYRGQAHRDGSVPGLGLGLHIARAIALAHGGELRCEDAPDGASFSLTLRYER
jgi:signal transduction histidine kinase